MKLIKFIKSTLVAFLISGMISFAGPGEVKIAWDANNPVENVTTYRVYYGQQSGTYTGTVDVPSVPVDVNGIMTIFHDLQLTGGRYYVAVTAVNADGESGYSNEITLNLPNKPQNPRKAPQGQTP